METKTQKILTCFGIAGGVILVVGFVGAMVALWIGTVIDDKFEAATPVSVAALDKKVDLLSNDLTHYNQNLTETRTELLALRSVIEQDLRCRANPAAC